MRKLHMPAHRAHAFLTKYRLVKYYILFVIVCAFNNKYIVVVLVQDYYL